MFPAVASYLSTESENVPTCLQTDEQIADYHYQAAGEMQTFAIYYYEPFHAAIRFESGTNDFPIHLQASLSMRPINSSKPHLESMKRSFLIPIGNMSWARSDPMRNGHLLQQVDDPHPAIWTDAFS